MFVLDVNAQDYTQIFNVEPIDLKLKILDSNMVYLPDTQFVSLTIINSDLPQPNTTT